jgi:uncharacterized membrane protein
MKKIAVLLCWFLMGSALQAQVLSLSPVFPKETDTVTIVYNAKLGNGALIGATQVYAHTGVITTLSTGGSDWKHVVGNWGTADARTKMTSLGNDKWQIRYHVKDFYSQAGAFATNETVLQLASEMPMVLRWVAALPAPTFSRPFIRLDWPQNLLCPKSKTVLSALHLPKKSKCGLAEFVPLC